MSGRGSKALGLPFRMRLWGALCALAAQTVEPAVLGAMLDSAGEPLGAVARAGQTFHVSVVNMRDLPIAGQSVSLDGQKVYECLGGEPWRPVVGVTPEGNQVPVIPGMERGRRVLRLPLSLNAGSRVDVRFVPVDAWVCATTGVWRDEDKTGEISNGVLTVRLAKADAHGRQHVRVSASGVRYPSVPEPPPEDNLMDVSYRGWLSEGDRHINRDLAKEAGRLKLPSLEPKSARVQEGHAERNERQATLSFVRAYAEDGKQVNVRETYELPAGLPVMDCTLEVANLGTEPLLLEGELFGGLSDKAWCGESRFRTQSGFEGEANMDKPRQSPLFGMYSPAGRLYGIAQATLPARFSLDEINPIFRIGHRQFALSQQLHPRNGRTYGPALSAPLPMGAGETITLKYRFLVTGPGVDSFGQLKAFQADAEKDQTAGVASAFAVFMGGQAVHGARTPFIHVGPDRFNLLAESGGAWMRSGGGVVGLQAFDASATARTALHIEYALDPVLSVVLNELTPGALWSVWASPLGMDGGDRVELLRTTQVGPHSVDLGDYAERLKGATELVFDFTVAGPANCRAAVESISVSPKPMAPPMVFSPKDGWALTDVGVFFVARNPDPGRVPLFYEIQVSRSAAFQDNLPVRKVLPFGPERTCRYMPDDLLAAGQWFWRVRAVDEFGRPGRWCEPHGISVNAEHGMNALTRPITPENPLFTLELTQVSSLRPFVGAIPEDVRPYVAYNASSPAPVEEFYQPAIEHNIPMMKYYNPQYGYTSLAEIEWFFQQVPSSIGVMGGEYMYSFLPSYAGSGRSWAYRDHVLRLITLCAKYGKVYVWADGQDGRMRWLQLAADPIWQEWLKQYHPYVIFGTKSNICNLYHISQGATLGLWLSGLIDNRIVWEEAFYWDHAGFPGRFQESIGFRKGKWHDMPVMLRAQQFLLGAAHGSAMFAVQGQPAVMQVAYTGIHDRQGAMSENWNRYLLPFIRAVVSRKLVATRAEVLDNIKLAVTLSEKPADVRHESLWGPWRDLYKATVGLDEPFSQFTEIMPNDGRYYFIPILPHGCDSAPASVKRVPLEALVGEKEVKAMFDAAYPSFYQGNAWVAVLGEKIFINNSNENRDLAQTYSIPFERGAIRALEGAVEPHSYLVGRREGNGNALWLQANTQYPERESALRVTCATRPSVRVEPADALRRETWEPESGTISLGLSHAHGAVEVVLESGDL